MCYFQPLTNPSLLFDYYLYLNLLSFHLLCYKLGEELNATCMEEIHSIN